MILIIILINTNFVSLKLCIFLFILCFTSLIIQNNYKSFKYSPLPALKNFRFQQSILTTNVQEFISFFLHIYFKKSNFNQIFTSQLSTRFSQQQILLEIEIILSNKTIKKKKIYVLIQNFICWDQLGTKTNVFQLGLQVEEDLRKRAGELQAEELEQSLFICADPRSYKIPGWFLNRRKQVTIRTKQRKRNWKLLHPKNRPQLAPQKSRKRRIFPLQKGNKLIGMQPLCHLQRGTNDPRKDMKNEKRGRFLKGSYFLK
eukprot:TRINITY_DN9661_c0_g1_i4.p2 TRINITY_DN9661_c0_g1~~TRINITY_DN9661_c0_g1_i4.p2  ORF type:complete len:258 (-),score=8.65 TRINITY_DN9661_c0_g1_i4:116-889(-)